MKEGINMGEIFVLVNVSLDGYIERENHEIEWQFVDDEFEESPRHICRSALRRSVLPIGRGVDPLWWTPDSGVRPGEGVPDGASVEVPGGVPA
jgi:hypothetical protein